MHYEILSRRHNISRIQIQMEHLNSYTNFLVFGGVFNLAARLIQNYRRKSLQVLALPFYTMHLGNFEMWHYFYVIMQFFIDCYD